MGSIIPSVTFQFVNPPSFSTCGSSNVQVALEEDSQMAVELQNVCNARLDMLAQRGLQFQSNARQESMQQQKALVARNALMVHFLHCQACPIASIVLLVNTLSQAPKNAHFARVDAIRIRKARGSARIATTLIPARLPTLLPRMLNNAIAKKGSTIVLVLVVKHVSSACLARRVGLFLHRWKVFMWRLSTRQQDTTMCTNASSKIGALKAIWDPVSLLAANVLAP